MRRRHVAFATGIDPRHENKPQQSLRLFFMRDESLTRAQLALLLVLSPLDGARARHRVVDRFDYEHEHHFMEHEHEQDTRYVEWQGQSRARAVVGRSSRTDRHAQDKHPQVKEHQPANQKENRVRQHHGYQCADS